MLIICVVFPYVYMNTPIQATSFAIVEGVMVIGLIPLVWKLSLLSKFDLGGKSSRELSRLVLTYKKICHQEKVWMIGAVCLALIAFYILELGFNTKAGYEYSTRLLLPLGLSLLTFGLGLWSWPCLCQMATSSPRPANPGDRTRAGGTPRVREIRNIILCLYDC